MITLIHSEHASLDHVVHICSLVSEASNAPQASLFSFSSRLHMTLQRSDMLLKYAVDECYHRVQMCPSYAWVL